MTASDTRDISGNHGVYQVEIWTRRTLADGSEMYNKCIKPICEAIEDVGSGISGLSGAIDYVSGALDNEVARAISVEGALSADITTEVNRAKNIEGELSSAISAESARAISAETVLQTNINNEASARNDADQKLQQQIDTLEAATDVIDVFGTYSKFNTEWKTKYFPTGKKPTITDNDIIKIINDEHTPVGDTGNLTTGHQTYYQWTWTATTHTTTADGDWNFIGFTEPYYNTAEIDGIISDTKTELSSMVSNNYLSAKGAVLTGRNIAITEEVNNPKITIATKDDVDFNTVSAATAYGSSAKFDNISATNVTALKAEGTNAIYNNVSAKSSLSGKELSIETSAKIPTISATTLTALSALGDSAKYIELSASGISSNSAIINTISGHSAHFDEIDISAIDLDNIIAKNISATSTFSGLDLTISNSAKIVGISSTNVSSTNISGKNVKVDYITAINVNASNVSSTNISALSLTANTASGQSANFDNISGKNISANIISGTNVTGTNIDVDKLTVNTSAKIDGISATNVSSTNISAKNISGLDNITAKSGYFTDISATNNISAESATIVNVSADVLSASNIYSNISSFFKDVSATKLTASFGKIPNFSTDELTAESFISSKNITADYIEGTSAEITNITGESGYFNDLRGETLHGVNSSINVDELISAVSSTSGGSNIYVRKDELECKIGSANSATNQSFAQGKSNSAKENSFVQGYLNSANEESFAQGYYNSADKRSFAQGYYNTAYYESLAQGQTNRVSNDSMGQGQGNSATNYSIAQGYHNDASKSAQAFGSNLVIESAMAIGKFNKTSSDAVFVIGNGTADNARNDLMVVDNSSNITLNREEANDINSVTISPNILSGTYSSNRGGIISTGKYQSDWISICRNASGNYVPTTANQCSIGEANNTAQGNYVLVQGESNLAYDYSFAQGISNTAKSNSIAQGSGNSAEKNAQAFGEQAYASAGVAINPHCWGSTTPTMAINNSFAMGKECVATADSFAFGLNNTATVFGMAFGQNNTASNFSVAFGLGISADNNQYIYGKYPYVGNNTVFAIGNGTADNDRSNYVSINKYGTLNLKNGVSNVNKSVIINGHEGYIRSEEKYRNIPMLLTSGYALTTTITESLLYTPTINAETLLLYGNDSDYLNMWVPTGTSGNKFKIMKVASSGTYKISIGIQAGYDMIFKNFSSGTTLASRKKIQTDNTGTSWPTPQQGTNISTSAKLFYFSAESNTTCVQFTEIPGCDDIDVIVDSFGKHFIMIKNHSEV